MSTVAFDSTRRIPALDGLRAIAATLVVYQHTWGKVHLGRLGVEVFFALSGFLVGGILMDTAGRPGWVSSFASRRVARIWPLYFLTVAIIVLTERWAFAPNHIPEWMLWTGTANFGAADLPGVPQRLAALVLWSVCIEEHAYILFPIVIRSVKRSWLPWVLLALALTSIGFRVWLDESHVLKGMHYTQARLDGLCFGIIGAWVVRYRPQWCGVAAYVGLFAIGWRLANVEREIWILGDPYTAIVHQSMGSLGAAGLIAALASDRLTFVHSILSLRPLRALGAISYGLYMLHGLVWDAWMAFWPMAPGPILFVIVLLLTIGVAELSFHLFEQPILRLAHRAPRPAASVTYGVPVSD